VRGGKGGNHKRGMGGWVGERRLSQRNTEGLGDNNMNIGGAKKKKAKKDITLKATTNSKPGGLHQ